MYQIISDINKPVILQQYIDNKSGNKKIGLKSFTYTFGWYNLKNEYLQKDSREKIRFESGFYSFQQIAKKFKEEDIDITVNRTNGIVNITTPVELRISKDLKKMLGIDFKKILPGRENKGRKTIDLAPYKQLYIHLHQLNTSHNFFNGAPSNILGVVSIENKSYGDIVHRHFSNPEYKQLSHGDISELNISVCDENNNKIDNNDLPMSCVLEII